MRLLYNNIQGWHIYMDVYSMCVCMRVGVHTVCARHQMQWHNLSMFHLSCVCLYKGSVLSTVHYSHSSVTIHLCSQSCSTEGVCPAPPAYVVQHVCQWDSVALHIVQTGNMKVVILRSFPWQSCSLDCFLGFSTAAPSTPPPSLPP